ncbi:MAG: hypothetical protein HFJ91_05375 [Muribaculaceae bacterium]|nr:hypothetical protein [Muribaculaceae bacterium]
MKTIIHLLALLTGAMLLSACGGNDDFVIDCEIEGLGNRGLELMYVDRDVKRMPFHPVDGKVRMNIPLTKPTILEIYTLDNRLLFTCLGRKSEHIKVKMNLDTPTSLVIEGQDESRDYALFVTENDSLLQNGSDRDVNGLIAKAIRANPATMASSMLLITHFRTAGYELLADSLLNTITPEARPVSIVGSYASLLGEFMAATVKDVLPAISVRAASDTTVRYTPAMQSYALILVNDSRKPDSTLRRLRSLRADTRQRNIAIVELSLATDSASWKNTISADSSTWQQAWVPGGMGSTTMKDFTVTRVPFYFVADSTGKVLYRGTSLHHADTLLRTLVKAGKNSKATTDTVSATTDTVPRTETAVKFKKNTKTDATARK